MDRFDQVRKDPDILLDWDEAKKRLKFKYQEYWKTDHQDALFFLPLCERLNDSVKLRYATYLQNIDA